jgi:hypothetical protein
MGDRVKASFEGVMTIEGALVLGIYGFLPRIQRQLFVGIASVANKIGRLQGEIVVRPAQGVEGS